MFYNIWLLPFYHSFLFGHSYEVRLEKHSIKTTWNRQSWLQEQIFLTSHFCRELINSFLKVSNSFNCVHTQSSMTKQSVMSSLDFSVGSLINLRFQDKVHRRLLLLFFLYLSVWYFSLVPFTVSWLAKTIIQGTCVWHKKER